MPSPAPFLRVIKVEIIEAATAAGLQTAVNDFLAAQGEERLLVFDWRGDGTTSFWCHITYTEE